jgi:hypothetical protein
MAKRKVRRGGNLAVGAHFEVLLDVGQVKIIRWTLMPGAGLPPLPNPCPYIVFPRTDGLLERRIRQGRRVVVRRQKLVAGKPYLRTVGKDGLEQGLRNVGGGPVVFEKYPICCDLPIQQTPRAKRR